MALNPHSHLIVAVSPTDGASGAPTAGYAALSTPWTAGPIVITDTQDIGLDAEVSFSVSEDSTVSFAIFRDGTQIFNTSLTYSGFGAASYCQSTHFGWVDKALAAGTYSYEVRVGCFAPHAVTITVHNAVVTTPAISVAGTRGGSLLTVTGLANV